MESLITYIAQQLVDKPEQVELKVSEAEGGKTFELKVAPEDVGKVIGRDGRTINALRTLLAVTAQRKGVKARLEILDDRRQAQAQGQGAPAPAPASPPPDAPPPAGEP
ncbi:MAG TPA: KH domain-containing protein [Myxococcaceae bacterium]|nr:KH domain-containing protein [Myxococcaceae bacterium]